MISYPLQMTRLKEIENMILKSDIIKISIFEMDAIIFNDGKQGFDQLYSLNQEERIRILPVFEKPSDIPLLIKPYLGVEYNPNDFGGFIEKLYKEILRK